MSATTLEKLTKVGERELAEPFDRGERRKASHRSVSLLWCGAAMGSQGLSAPTQSVPAGGNIASDNRDCKSCMYAV